MDVHNSSRLVVPSARVGAIVVAIWMGRYGDTPRQSSPLLSPSSWPVSWHPPPRATRFPRPTGTKLTPGRNSYLTGTRSAEGRRGQLVQSRAAHCRRDYSAHMTVDLRWGSFDQPRSGRRVRPCRGRSATSVPPKTFVPWTADDRRVVPSRVVTDAMRDALTCRDACDRADLHGARPRPCADSRTCDPSTIWLWRPPLPM
jgi:hypothetical protein